MAKLNLGKGLRLEVKGDIKIEKFIQVERGAVYNDGGTVTLNVTGPDPAAPAANESSAAPAAAAAPAPPERDPRPLPAAQLPPELATEAAMRYWKRLQEGGFVDERFQPLRSRTVMAVVAHDFAVRLGLESIWPPFEKLWHKNYLRKDYDAALDQRKTLALQSELKQLFG